MNQEWKRVKARKDHKCDCCDELILKGDYYDYFESRNAEFDDNDNQIGIYYLKVRHHPLELNCNWPDECKKGNHVEHYYTDNHPDSPNYGDTSCYCVNCATDLSDIEND